MNQFLNLQILSFLDPSTQKKVLGLSEDDKLPKVTFLDKLKQDHSLKHFTVEELKQLEERGYIIKDNFLNNEEKITNIKKEMYHLKDENKLKGAGMSTGETKWNDKNIRGDLHLWIHDTKKYEEECPNLVSLLDVLNDLKTDLNENCEFNSNKVQIQVTCYPGNNTKYVKHLDSKKEGPDRRITCLYYANKDWKKEDGGELRIYLEGKDEDKDNFVDVSPISDRLLIFQSRRLVHEVLETRADRFAITTWFY